MRLARVPVRLALAAVAACAAATAGAGDRTAAERAADRAKVELKAKRFPAAAAAYEDAVRLDASYVPARVGLAEARILGGDRGGGLEVLRVLVETLDPDDTMRRVWAKELTKAKDLLRARDEGGRRLDGLVDDHVAALLRLVKPATTADPELARALVREAAALRPRHPDVGPLVLRLGLADAGEALWNGVDASGWMWLEDPAWVIEDGAIVGTATDVYAVTRTVLALVGDYDLRCEARVLAGGAPVLLLSGGWNEFAEHVSVGLNGKGVLLIDGRTMSGTNDPPHATPIVPRTPVRPSEWTHFELRFRGDRVSGHVDGREVGSIARPAGAQKGHVALAVLLGRVAFRRIEVVRR